MRAFHFLPRDAYHLATMRHHGIDSLVTLDADFVVVPDIEIFTCNPTILQQKA
jgi:predicted nucleic acid-binding protein